MKILLPLQTQSKIGNGMLLRRVTSSKPGDIDRELLQSNDDEVLFRGMSSGATGALLIVT